MDKKVKKIFLSILILGMASFSLIEEEILEVLWCHSGTYAITFIKHNRLFIFGMSLILGFFIFYSVERKLSRFYFGISFLIWIISLRTIAVDKNIKPTVIVSGFSFFPISRREEVKEGDCDVWFDFFLDDDVKRAIAE